MQKCWLCPFVEPDLYIFLTQSLNFRESFGVEQPFGALQTTP